MVFAPVAILIAAAMFTAFGGGIAHKANAASLTINATVTSAKSITPCGASVSFATLGTAGLQTTSECSVSFGATNDVGAASIAYTAGSTKLLGASGLGSAKFTDKSATFAALGANEAGVKLSNNTSSGGTGTAKNSFVKSSNAANTDYRGVPAAGAPVVFCDSNGAIGAVTCYLTFGANVSGSVPADTYGSSVDLTVA
jgi:hypothetical protein